MYTLFIDGIEYADFSTYFKAIKVINELELFYYKAELYRTYYSVSNIKQKTELAYRKVNCPQIDVDVSKRGQRHNVEKALVRDGSYVMAHIPGSLVMKCFLMDFKRFPAQRPFLGKSVGERVLITTKKGTFDFLIDQIV